MLPNFSFVFDPSTVIRHESENYIGQVIVWESKQMEFEIFNIHTTERLLWNYIEKVPDQPNFDNILKTYFNNEGVS
ncbi:immunity protein TriTu family protein [Brevibacillus porteri]|uniref:immunity protein TriTu family protein n=1 Tax=Brevibacillus porteri TaxID=2126350 RepID=UPI003D1AD055